MSEQEKSSAIFYIFCFIGIAIGIFTAELRMSFFELNCVLVLVSIIGGTYLNVVL